MQKKFHKSGTQGLFLKFSKKSEFSPDFGGNILEHFFPPSSPGQGHDFRRKKLEILEFFGKKVEKNHVPPHMFPLFPNFFARFSNFFSTQNEHHE